MNENTRKNIYIIQCEDWNNVNPTNCLLIGNNTGFEEIPKNNTINLIKTGEKISADLILAIQEQSDSKDGNCYFFMHGSDFFKRSLSQTEIKVEDISEIERWKNGEDLEETLIVTVFVFQHEHQKCPVYDDLIYALNRHLIGEEDEAHSILEKITFKFDDDKRNLIRSQYLIDKGFSVKLNCEEHEKKFLDQMDNESMLI